MQMNKNAISLYLSDASEEAEQRLKAVEVALMLIPSAAKGGNSNFKLGTEINYLSEYADRIQEALKVTKEE